MVALYFVEAAEMSSGKKKREGDGPRELLVLQLCELIGDCVVEQLLCSHSARCEIMISGKVECVYDSCSLFSCASASPAHDILLPHSMKELSPHVLQLC